MYGYSYQYGRILGKGGGGGGGFDADAQAFFDRVTAASGSLTTTEQDAVNTLVVQMKADGIWDSMEAIYPMVGASAAACSQNLKSASFTGTFSSGWTFASTGVTPNGTNAFFNTEFNPVTQAQVANSCFLSVYLRTNTQGTHYDIGNLDSFSNGFKGTFIISRYTTAQKYLSISNGSYNTQNAEANSIAFWIGGTNGSSSQILYKNGISALTGISTFAGFSNSNIYIGAANQLGSAVGFSNKQNAFATIGNGLNASQVSNFYTAVQLFQTTLSRQV